MWSVSDIVGYSKKTQKGKHEKRAIWRVLKSSLKYGKVSAKKDKHQVTGRLRHLLCWRAGSPEDPATRLFHCNVNMQSPLVVGPVVHVGLPRRPIACSIPSLLAAGRGGGTARHRIPGEWAAPARWRDPCHAGAGMCDTATAC